MRIDWKRLLRSPRRRADVLAELRDCGGVNGTALASQYARDPDRETRMRAFEVLLKWGSDKYTDQAIRALRDEEDTVVATALQCLAEWSASQAVPAIGNLLKGESELSSAYAAWALGQLGARRFLPRLRRLVAHGSSTVVRTAAAEACAMLTAEPQFTRFILLQLSAPDPETRAFASNSLVGIANDTNIDELIRSLARAVEREPRPAIRTPMKANMVTLLTIRRSVVPKKKRRARHRRARWTR